MAVPSSRSRRLAPFLGILVAAGLLLQPMPLTAQRPINIKLATLVPSGTDLHHVLQDMAARWEEASGGRVKLTIYPDGRAGEEPEILRGMRTGDLQAGALSIAGLAHISTWVNVMAIPMSMESREDMARVRAAFEPRLEEVFREKGYEVLFWAEAGWVRFFLPEDDASIEKVKTYKFPAWGASATTDLWRDAGFQVVSVNIGEILPGLLTGLVDAVGTTPLVMGPNQWFTQAPYMIEMPFAPLLGATIIDRRAWERIPDDLRPELLRIARETGEENQDKIRDLETRAISAMVDNGLTIVTPPPDIVAEWRSLVESHYPGIKGAVIPADWFEEALAIARQGRGG
jgi:TRAP-type C4-dicarboxylate transport system substrate-binding protein